MIPSNSFEAIAFSAENPKLARKALGHEELVGSVVQAIMTRRKSPGEGVPDSVLGEAFAMVLTRFHNPEFTGASRSVGQAAARLINNSNLSHGKDI